VLHARTRVDSWILVHMAPKNRLPRPYRGYFRSLKVQLWLPIARWLIDCSAWHHDACFKSARWIFENKCLDSLIVWLSLYHEKCLCLMINLYYGNCNAWVSFWTIRSCSFLKNILFRRVVQKIHSMLKIRFEFVFKALNFCLYFCSATCTTWKWNF